MADKAPVHYDLVELSGLGFRIKDNKASHALAELKGSQTTSEFIIKNKLFISKSTLNNWLNFEYGVPIDVLIKLLGYKNFRELEINSLSSGRSSSYCSAILPKKLTIQLAYLIGTLIGDGSLRHRSNKSYFISFEMADKKIISIIQSTFHRVFGLRKPIRTVKRNDGRKTYLLKYSNKIVYYFFNKFFDLGPKKTKTVGIKGLETINKYQKLAVLLGLYHTDGSLVKGNIRFYTSSRNLKRDVCRILRALDYNFKTYEYQRRSYSPEYQITVKSKEFVSRLKAIERRLL